MAVVLCGNEKKMHVYVEMHWKTHLQVAGDPFGQRLMGI
jgi:hypothetical protein